LACGKCVFTLAVWTAVWGLTQGQTPKASDEVCAACHDIGAKLKKSAHAGVGCATCHARHEEYPHPEGVAKPQCGQCHAREAAEYASSIHGQEKAKGNAAAADCNFCHGTAHELTPTKTFEFRKTVPDTCGTCHEGPASQFRGSIHGKLLAQGAGQAPTCATCHGAHIIQKPISPQSKVNPLHVVETCGGCHDGLVLTKRFGRAGTPVESYKESFHGLALKAGQPTVASCASCHGYHDILPSSDPRSHINPRNIAKTCGACHPGAGKEFQIGLVHVIDPKQKAPAVRWAEWFYLMLIPGTIGVMLLHHGGDFVRKVAWLRFRQQAWALSYRPAPTEGELRMLFWERIQHAVLTVSFLVLVITGFALHYPNAWWASPLLHWERTWPVRGTIHRCAAVVLLASSLLHVVLLIRVRMLRDRWKHFFPRASDLREAYEGTMWRLGLRKDQPYRSPHSYIEKAEYWAVVWGTVVMAATGTMLWLNNWMLQHVPKWGIDLARTIHFYEAVLATLAILVWHFYMVIFDPEVYPLDPAWLTGRSPRRQAHQEADDASA